MNTYYDFRFQTNVSLDTYEKKTDAQACLSMPGAKAIGKNKMAFKEQNVSISEFLDLATSGHAFCNLFDVDPNKKYWTTTSDNKPFLSYPVYKNGANKGALKLSFKCDKYFRGSQTIFVDIDNTKFSSIPEYISTLSLKPTCVYMSFSDNKDKHGKVSRRFRMVYIMDEIIGKDDFYYVSRAINNSIIFDTNEEMEDDCGTRMSQYMNGVYGNSETYRTDTIYSINDFDREGADYFLSIPEHNEPEDTKPTFDEKMLSDMEAMSYKDFTHHYSLRFKYIFRSEKENWTSLNYQYTDEDFLQLWYYREIQKDGQHRRRKLFKNACLRRLMMPEIDADTLLYNLYIDRQRFFDNSDNVITLDTLKRKVLNAMIMTPEELKDYCFYEIRYWKENRPKFICMPGAIKSPVEANMLSKFIRWDELDKIYDKNRSLKENLESNCSDVPERTLYRYCEERGINTNPYKDGMTEKERRTEKKSAKEAKIQLFKKYYDPDKSIRENIKVLEEKGLKISTRTVSLWIDKYYGVEAEIPSFDAFKNDLFKRKPCNINFDTSWFDMKENPKVEEAPKSLESFAYKPWINL